LAILRGEQSTASFATTSEEKEKHEAEALPWIISRGEWLVARVTSGPFPPDRAVLRKKIKGDFIWFRHNGKGYIIRDLPTIDAAKGFFPANPLSLAKITSASK
jgi:hypothetical protein